MIVGVLTNLHTQYTWDSSICIFFYLIEQHSQFATYPTGALYVHPLWFYKHQHDNRVRSKLSVACQRWWFLLHTHPVSWNCAYHLRMELSDGDSFPNLVWNCRWTIVADRNSLNLSTQNAFSLPFAAILVNRAPSGELHDYCTPHIIKENFENFLIRRCNYIVLFQVYCEWQVVKTPTIISNNPVYFCRLHMDGTVMTVLCFLCGRSYDHFHLYVSMLFDNNSEVSESLFWSCWIRLYANKLASAYSTRC